MAKKAWILTRVSSLKTTQDVSPENQEASLREYLSRNGWEVEGVSSDRISGQKGESGRPGLKQALDEARSGRVQCIAVTRLDRLARNLGTLLAVGTELKRVGCSLVIQDLSGMSWVDTETAVGSLLFHMLGALAEFQAKSYGEAALAGKARAEARGIHCARPREILPDDQGAVVRELVKTRIGWDAISSRLAGRGYLQPPRYIKSTGELRARRSWPPSTLRGAYAAWSSQATKCPPEKGPLKVAEMLGGNPSD
jgi:DNA invertase Pin-like site-specific DNA recombinase